MKHPYRVHEQWEHFESYLIPELSIKKDFVDPSEHTGRMHVHVIKQRKEKRFITFVSQKGKRGKNFRSLRNRILHDSIVPLAAGKSEAV